MDDDAQKIIDAAVKEVNPSDPPTPPGSAAPPSGILPTVEPPPSDTPVPPVADPMPPIPPSTPPIVEPVLSTVTPAAEPITAPTTNSPPPEPAPVPPGETPFVSTTPEAGVPPAASDLMDTLIHPSVMPVAADITSAEQSMAPQAPPTEKPKKKRGGKGILIATLLVLLLTLPLAVFFISSRQQIADIRNRAAVCCEGGVCGDGSTFGGDPSYPFGTCDDRNRSACDGTNERGSGGVVSGGGQCGGQSNPTPTPTPGSGASCGSRAVDGQYVCLTIVPPECKQCVNGLYRDTALSNCAGLPCNPGGTSGGTPTPTPTPGGGSGTGGWNQCTSSTGPIPCGSCDIKSVGAGTMSFGCELNCGGSASNCPGGSAGSYSIDHKWFHCKNKGGAACGPGNADFDGEGGLGGSGPWSISGQSLVNGSGTFPNSTCGRVQIDVKMSAGGTNVAGGVYDSGTNCGGSNPTPTPGGSSNPTPTPTPAPQCTAIKIYDAEGADITTAVKDKTRKLKLGETITLGTPKGSADKAHFRIQGITDFTDNDTAISTATEYRLKIVIPTTITQTQGNFEVEIFVGGQWR